MKLRAGGRVDFGPDAAINAGGAVVSLVISLATVPAYLHLIGETRFGVLAIVWVVLGYFGAFDFGLARATAHYVARMQDQPPIARERVFLDLLLASTRPSAQSEESFSSLSGGSFSVMS